jgi:hypothetical protein
MKTNMKRHFFLTALFLPAAVALFAASPARAQIQAEDWNMTIQGSKLKQGTNQAVPATLNNAVAALRRLYPDENIVLEPGVGQITIGDVVLHCTEPGNDLEAFSIASGRAFILEKHLSEVEPRGYSPFDRGVPTNILLVLKANKPPPDAKTDKKVAAFNLSDYFAFKHVGMTTDNAKNQAEIAGHLNRLENIVLDTVIASHSDGDTTHPEMRFYPDANLLIVIGSEDDLQAARVVIGALPGMGGGRSSFQQNFRRFQGAQDAADGKTPALPAAPAPPAAPVPPQNPVLPEAPPPPQNPPE